MSKHEALEIAEHINGRSETTIGLDVSNNQNTWLRIRDHLREPFAEFLGVFLSIICGIGVVCQVVLSGDTNIAPSPRGDYDAIAFGWAAGKAVGVWVAGGISGGHINPAVTLAFAVFRGFPWRKVPGYILSQILGGIAGAAVIYGIYFNAIDIFEGQGVRTLKTAGIFATYALDYTTNIAAFFNEFLATSTLIIVILAVHDKKNTPLPIGLIPLALFVVVLAIGICLGMQTSYAINPARDLGPRILLAMVGYGKDVFTYRSHYWIWCPLLGPVSGALFGALIYDAFLYDGIDNIFLKQREKTIDFQESFV